MIEKLIEIVAPVMKPKQQLMLINEAQNVIE